ncbi:hypothetical protein NPIL_410941 [Nephila pilipes]|uniref:Uncharacterized protein n=1 Tax=Nephila pilipes TaxID=299642 RepID=A0A8X6KHF7_NEPPI|nr:hypothetical protein NPIL_410941 [Nephila pilipes]
MRRRLYLEIQLVYKVLATASAEISTSRIFSGHLESLCTQVRQLWKPSDGGKSPTRSTCTCSNQELEWLEISNLTFVYRDNFECRHCKHARAHRIIPCSIDDQI